jgi:hypothetical protein
MIDPDERRKVAVVKSLQVPQRVDLSRKHEGYKMVKPCFYIPLSNKTDWQRKLGQWEVMGSIGSKVSCASGLVITAT